MGNDDAARMTRVSVEPRRETDLGAVRPSSAVSLVLTPELLRAVVRRLRIVGILNTIVPSLILVLDVTFRRPMATPASAAITATALVAAALLGLAMTWLSFRLDPRVLLEIAVAYEIVMGFLIAVQSHAAPVDIQAATRAWPVVAVWMIVFALLIPNTRRKTAFATMATAAMDPLGLVVHLLAGASTPTVSQWFLIFFPTPLAAVVTIYLSRILYNLSIAVKEAREFGSYHLVRRLGHGGMGEVWEGEHRLLARSAAIKLIRPDALGPKAVEMMKRFEREARATAALRSPHTVAVYDFGLTEEGAFYYVMELLTGLDADTLVGRHGPLPPERAAHLLIQVCRSLEEAHAQQFVHRDIKPANIFVCRYGLEYDFVKVLDFGLVKSVGFVDESGLTASGVVAGTPDYIAPEIARSERGFDHRADLYSLGCVAYWLVSGKPVFEAATPIDVLIEHVRTRPTPPSVKASLPIHPGLEEIILWCLQKDPANRPQSAGDLARRLEELDLPAWDAKRAAAWWREVPLAGDDRTRTPPGDASLHKEKRVAVIQDPPL